VGPALRAGNPIATVTSVVKVVYELSTPEWVKKTKVIRLSLLKFLGCSINNIDNLSYKNDLIMYSLIFNASGVGSGLI
jgi:hypothetical protein